MTLHPPFIITPRLMPGVKVGNAFISLNTGPLNNKHRTAYSAFIDIGREEYEVTDLRSGCGRGNVQDGFALLLSFLGAAAEAYRYNGHQYTNDPDSNCALFPQFVVEWAYQHSDELQMLEMEIEETLNLIES